MMKDNIVNLKKPAVIKDMLTEVIRNGARELLAAAIEAEVNEFLQAHNAPESKARFVRNGYLLEREIQTGIGGVAVEMPRVRARDQSSDGSQFSSSLIPKYLRRSTSMNEFLPLLYLKGISTNDFTDALRPLFGENAKNLSPGVISRLKAEWEGEYEAWCKRNLQRKEYVYWWADGIHLHARMEESSECVLVIVGVTVQGSKEILAIEGGHRESKESWLILLRN